MNTGGNITRRGKSSWRIKYDIGRDPVTGERQTRYITVRGTKKDAQRELTRVLHEIDLGAHVDATKESVGEYLERWLRDYAKGEVAPKTFERYSEIVTKHLKPALGAIVLKDLKPLQIQGYYSAALESGRLNGKGGLSPRTVHHFHRILSEALKKAVQWRMLAINPAEAVTPPKPEQTEIEILNNDELARLLQEARPTRSFPAILLAATTGMRRGEVLAVRWRDIDLDAAVLTVNQAVEETRAGLRLKSPKTKRSRRNITLPALTVDALRRHRLLQLEERMKLGLGRDHDGLVFTDLEGGLVRPRNLTKEFGRIVKRTGLRPVTFHGLRHTHITTLLGDGVNAKVVSERAGHASVAITLDIYGHVIPNMQADAAARVDTALRGTLEELT
jgi:integrase